MKVSCMVMAAREEEAPPTDAFNQSCSAQMLKIQEAGLLSNPLN